MNTVPANIFEEEIAPVHRPSPEEVKALAETMDFRSRQPATKRRGEEDRKNRAIRLPHYAGGRRNDLSDFRGTGLDYRRHRRARPGSS